VLMTRRSEFSIVEYQQNCLYSVVVVYRRTKAAKSYREERIVFIALLSIKRLQKIQELTDKSDHHRPIIMPAIIAVH
jgi:hypothetical protein